MVKGEILQILEGSKERGWVLEPDAMRVFSSAGLPVPRFVSTRSNQEAKDFAGRIGYPVVAKIVSPVIIHKSDVGGVVVSVRNDDDLDAAFVRLSRLDGFEGVIVEESLAGTELIIGASVDYQFGPAVLLGLGGTAVEVYKDTSIRLAPLEPKDVKSMVSGLKAHQLLEGYRGAEPVNMEKLTELLVLFSNLVMEMEYLIESVDLNPVMCTSTRCTIADARIILSK